MSYIRNLLPKTLLTRFMLIIIVPTLIGQVLAIFLFYDRHWYNVSYYTSNIIANEINSLINNFHIYKVAMPDSRVDYLNLSYQFYEHEKLPRKQPKLTEELEIFKNILNNKVSLHKIIKDGKDKIIVLVAIDDGVLKIFFSSKILLSPTTYIFILWLIFLTIVLLSISLVFCKKQINSILELTSAADDFGKGLQSTITYKPTGSKEIRRAGFAFIRMKERIEKQVLKRTQMLAMISHDLRTPLTRMKLQLELMDLNEETIGLKQDVISMEQMVNAYLDFTRGEGGENFQIINLSIWLSELIKNKWNSTDISPIIDCDIQVNIKPFSFERAINNIIDNAKKYATKIDISLHIESIHAIILIEDNGIGIEDHEKDSVFKPFYRSNKSRTIGSSSSIGLGLAITKEIINGHYGNVTLEDSARLGGLKVKIELPLI